MDIKKGMISIENSLDIIKVCQGMRGNSVGLLGKVVLRPRLCKTTDLADTAGSWEYRYARLVQKKSRYQPC